MEILMYKYCNIVLKYSTFGKVTLCVCTSELKVLSSSAPRATSAHSPSARRVRLHSNQQQLHEEEAMVRARGGSVVVGRGSIRTLYSQN